MVHWPSNPPVRLERVADLANGASSNVSQLSLGVHTGTHVDAPVHFYSDGVGVDQIPLDALIGPARVLAIEHAIHVTTEELDAANVQPGERILLKTRNSPAAWKATVFVEDAIHLSTEAAHWLAERQIKTLGIDYLSVGGRAAKNGRAVHHALMRAGIWIIEGLDLTNAPTGPCDLVCLPLKLVGSDGAPARAIVRPHRPDR